MIRLLPTDTLRTARRAFLFALGCVLLSTAACGEASGPEAIPDPDDAPLVLRTDPWRATRFGDPANLGEQATVVLLATFEGMRATTRSPEDYQAAVFDHVNSVNAFVTEASYGRAWLSGSVHGWYALEGPSPCNQQTLTRAVIDGADDDVDFHGVRRILVITPQRPDDDLCVPPYPAGMGTIGTTLLDTEDGPVEASVTHVIWEGYVSLDQRPAARVLAHELMHNFGMWHENGYECGAVPIRSTGTGCQSFEYANRYSILGSGTLATHVSAFAKERIGWLPEEEILTATETGRYVLHPLEIAGSGPKAIRIPLDAPARMATRGNGELAPATEYYVEYRRPTGFDNTLPVTEGVIVYAWAERHDHLAFFDRRTQVVTLLLDATPGSRQPSASGTDAPDDYSDAALTLGQVFKDPETGITISPLRVRDDGSVEVYVGRHR